MSTAKPPLSTTWASSAPSGPTGIEDPGGLKNAGWSVVSACPPFSWLNWILNKCDAGLRYLLARGIPDYDVNESYSVGDCMQFGGMTYRCIVAHAGNGTGAGNPQNTPANWTRWARSIPTYLAGDSYQAGDCVIAPSDGCTYQCLVYNGPGAVHEPHASPTYWERWGHTNAEVIDIVTSNIPIALATSSTGITLTTGSVSNVLDVRYGQATVIRELAFTLDDIPSAPGYIDVTLSPPIAFGEGIGNIQVLAAHPTNEAPYGQKLSANVVRIFCLNYGGPMSTVFVRLLGY